MDTFKIHSHKVFSFSDSRFIIIMKQGTKTTGLITEQRFVSLAANFCSLLISVTLWMQAAVQGTAINFKSSFATTSQLYCQRAATHT